MKNTSILLLTLISIIFFNTAKAQLVYKDVAQIFFNNCTSCHHSGGGTPMPLMNFTQTSSYASSILYHVEEGHMPPWSPDTSFSRFIGERIITQAEKNDIISWVNSGALAGDTTLAPPAPVYTTEYKLIGTPSLILKMPTFVSNAGSTDSYVCFTIPSGLTQDRILRAYEIVPGNPDIVHHVIVNIDTAGTSATDLSGNCFNAPGDLSIGGYAPGSAPIIFPGEFPLKAGINIPAGSNIVMQLHYPPGTSGMVDSTQIRMYFYPLNETGIRPVHNSTLLQNWGLYMLPNTVSSFSDEYPDPDNGVLPASFSMFSAFPHSHKVCVSIENYAYAGTDTIPLIRINEWDFMWQGYYTFSKLVKIPAGYKLFSKHVYDNTANNLNNPNSPPALVIAGTRTTDEMLFDSFLWLDYEPGDELIDLQGLLANDTLLALKTNNIKPVSPVKVFVYPNPASDKLCINLSKKAEYKARFLNIAGQTILNLETFSDNATIDLSKVPAGLYIVEVLELKTGERVSKKIAVTK